MKLILIAAFFYCYLYHRYNFNAFGAPIGSIPADSKNHQSAWGSYKHAAVAADNGVCSNIGNDILKRGGNAVDAIIATAICIGVMDSHSSGLGGGHFLTVYNKTSKTCIVFDARERASEKIDENIYRNNSQLSKKGWLSIAVPGEVHGFWTAYKTSGGKVPWKDLWTPTINLCRQGFKISPALAKALKDQAETLESSSYFQDFKNPKTGKVLEENGQVTLPLLGDTMERIANSDDPVRLFYNSNWTDAMIAEIQNNGGIITREDMRNYRTRFGDDQRPPIYTHLKSGLTFCAPPPPSSAALTTSIINVLDGYNITHSVKNNAGDMAQLYHLFVETMKFSYGVRSRMGDMDYVPSAYHTADSVSYPGFGLLVREKIRDKSAKDPNYYGAGLFAFDSGTSHISVVDQYGNAASLTTSINTYFGSKVRSNVTGIIYNDEIDDFSIPGMKNFFDIEPTNENRMASGKRPQSSMSPLVVFNRNNGQVKMALGSAGGIKIIAGVAHVIMRVLFLNETIQQAIDAPRIYNQLIPFPTTHEDDFPKEILERLSSDYNQLINDKIEQFYTVICGINRLPNGVLEASSDYRKGGGFPAGF